MNDRLLRILVLTNMWPSIQEPTSGIYVKEQVDALQILAPGLKLEPMVIESARSRIEYLRTVSRLKRKLESGYDLVHAHYGLTAAVAVTQSHCPVVATFHGSDIYIGWQRLISRFATRRAAASIFVSERLRQKMGCPNGRIIPCGVDLGYFRPRERSAARELLGWSQRRRLVLFPGNPDNAMKNYSLFEAVLSTLPDPLRRETDPVILTGVPREKVPLYLAAVDAVLITSRYEGACTVAKEALACGRPVVSVVVGDVPEMVSGVPGCAVALSEPEALAAALTRALEGGGSGGPQRLKDLEADSVGVARRVLELYRSVLKAGMEEENPEVGVPPGDSASLGVVG